MQLLEGLHLDPGNRVIGGLRFGCHLYHDDRLVLSLVTLGFPGREMGLLKLVDILFGVGLDRGLQLCQPCDSGDGVPSIDTFLAFFCRLICADIEFNIDVLLQFHGR